MPPWSYDVSVLDERLQSLEKRVTELTQIVIKLLNILQGDNNEQ